MRHLLTDQERDIMTMILLMMKEFSGAIKTVRDIWKIENE